MPFPLGIVCRLKVWWRCTCNYAFSRSSARLLNSSLRNFLTHPEKCSITGGMRNRQSGASLGRSREAHCSFIHSIPKAAPLFCSCTLICSHQLLPDWLPRSSHGRHSHCPQNSLWLLGNPLLPLLRRGVCVWILYCLKGQSREGVGLIPTVVLGPSKCQQPLPM